MPVRPPRVPSLTAPRPAALVLVVLAALVAFVAVALATACGNSEAPDTTEATTPPAATSVAATATAPGSVLPPLGVATVTVDVPAGTQSRTLLVIEGSTLTLLEPDGGRHEVTTLAPGAGTPAFPAWSPDGESIAFVARSFVLSDPEADWGDDVYVVSRDGGQPRLVRKHTAKGEQVFGLAWRPEGEHLLLGRIDIELRNGIPAAIAGAAVVELDVASGGERTIVEGAYDPSLSSDGARLAYLALGELPTETTVVVANGDGSDPIALVESTDYEVLRFPRISPDGASVAFTAAERLTASRDGGGLDGRGRAEGWIAAILGPLFPRRAEAHGIPMDIWLADVETAEVQQVTGIGEDDPYPAWSPDGETVVFMATNGLYEVALNEGEDGLVRTGNGAFDGQVAVEPE